MKLRLLDFKVIVSVLDSLNTLESWIPSLRHYFDVQLAAPIWILKYSRKLDFKVFASS